MNVLVLIEHEGGKVKDASLATVTAAAQLGSVHALVAGEGDEARQAAEATGNPQFTRFLEFLGRFVPPRQNLRPGGGQDRRAYLEMIQGEHRRIFQAIEAGNPTAARAAMRRHLEGSRQRYSRLAAKASNS